MTIPRINIFFRICIEDVDTDSRVIIYTFYLNCVSLILFFCILEDYNKSYGKHTVHEPNSLTLSL